MENHKNFLENLKVSESKKLFEIALDIMFRKNDASNARLDKYKSLSHQEKIDITKIIKFLNFAGFATKKKNEQGVEYYFNQSEKLSAKEKDFLYGILQVVEFDKTLNNYRLIIDQGKDTNSSWIERKSLLPFGQRIFNNYVSVEWKIEVILSSIAMKRVLRPVVLLIIHTKQGRESFYVDATHFQELRKNFALMLRQIHQIEFKP